ncbi:hypothetical protein Anapl_09898 [Anas platyrhynchos]|uniref:Uncharacterized protein n=1 Tax=Anas platyrhynchos TaxID=8839 RepID=R0LUG2_ANAPL|nr:hypothetical protein Anapl_09898 [Anas platyrhynchos]
MKIGPVPPEEHQDGGRRAPSSEPKEQTPTGPQQQPPVWRLPAKLTHHSDQEVSSRSERRAPHGQEWPQLRANTGGCGNSSAATQRLPHKEKFHFCWSSQ